MIALKIILLQAFWFAVVLNGHNASIALLTGVAILCTIANFFIFKSKI
jgi:hypothetical protein